MTKRCPTIKENIYGYWFPWWRRRLNDQCNVYGRLTLWPLFDVPNPLFPIWHSFPSDTGVKKQPLGESLHSGLTILRYGCNNFLLLPSEGATEREFTLLSSYGRIPTPYLYYRVKKIILWRRSPFTFGHGETYRILTYPYNSLLVAEQRNSL